MISPEDRPRIAKMARLRFDEKRQSWLLVYPERGLALSATAAGILELCDGERTVTQIAEALVQKYDQSSLEAVTKDVTTFLQTMLERALLETV
jgi:pyrroloquinoline quinone biosynthesis protein D